MTFLTTIEGGVQGADENALPDTPFGPIVVVGENLDVLFAHRVASVDDVLAYSGYQGAVDVVRVLGVFAPSLVSPTSGLANIFVVAR